MFKNFTILAGVYLALACSSQVTERSDDSAFDRSVIEGDEKIVFPSEITGSYLADFDNARVRCSLVQKKNKNDDEKVNCFTVILVDGEEVLANGWVRGTKVNWNDYAVLDGSVDEVNCVLKNNDLAQECLVRPKTNSVKLRFAFTVSKDGKSRQESADVLLPYSVRVAAGFVPNLALYRSDVKSENIDSSFSGGTEDQKILHGLQTQVFDQSVAEVTAKRESSCVSSGSLYFTHIRSIFKMQGDKIQHFAGSHFSSPENQLSHSLRYFFKEQPSITCTDSGLYFWDEDKIVFVNAAGFMTQIISDDSLKSTRYINNFHAMKNGDLYFQQGPDLMKYDVTAKDIKLYIKDFNITFAAKPVKGKRFFFRAENGDEFFRDEYIYDITKSAKLTWFKKSGEILSILFRNYKNHPLPIAVTDAIISEPIFGRDGSIYFINPGAMISYGVSENGKMRKVSPDGTSSDITEILRYDYHQHNTLDLLGVGDDDLVYAFDTSVPKIIKISKDGVVLPPAILDIHHNSIPVAKSQLTPSAPLALPSGAKFLNGTRFLAMNDSEISPENDMIGCGSIFKDVDPVPTAYAPDGSIYYACFGKIYKYKNKILEIVMQVRGGVAEGPLETVAIGYPQALAIGNDGALYWAENSAIKKLLNGQVSFVFGKNQYITDPKDYIGYISGLSVDEKSNVYFADQMTSRIFKVTYENSVYQPNITKIAGTDPLYFSSNLGVISGNDGPAINSVLNNPHTIARSSDGVLYYIDNGDNPMFSTVGTVIRKIENQTLDGVSQPVISHFFGGTNSKECGSAKTAGTTRIESLNDVLQSSLSVICIGKITGVSTYDNCHESDGSVKIIITQAFGESAGNIVEVIRPCKKLVTK